MKRNITMTAVLLVLGASCGTTNLAFAEAVKQEKPKMTDEKITQLVKTDARIGTGKEAVNNKLVIVHYTGWLYDARAPKNRGAKFDSSVDRSQPFDFMLGAGQVIKGWDQGVAGMKVGGQRTLIIPPEMGYGVRGAGGVIPPNATLVFDVELLDVK